MVTPTVGSVVLIPFPFSDLSQSKLRPAVVLAQASRQDWILCQVTSKTYSDRRAVQLNNADFSQGALKITSYARPGKLFTADVKLMVAIAGQLKQEKLTQIIGKVVNIFQSGL